MAFVITNGHYYINTDRNGRVIKTRNKNEVQQYQNVKDANCIMLRAPARCSGYYIIAAGDKASMDKKYKKKHFQPSVRKMIYDEANGRCALDGRKIAYEDMTLDHIEPLDVGGADEVSNLQCTCFSCNQFKGNVRPDDFMNRITEIFLYQMNKKNVYSVRWKIVHGLVKSMI